MSDIKMLMLGQVAMEISPEGSMLLAFNDASQPGRRTPLTLSSSTNHGQSWEEALVLEDNLTGSFSYPTLLCPSAADSCFAIYTVNVRPAMPAAQRPPCNCLHAQSICGNMPSQADPDHPAALQVTPHSTSCGNQPLTSTEALQPHQRAEASLLSWQHQKGCSPGAYSAAMQTYARAAAFGALSEQRLTPGCLHEMVQAPAAGMHQNNASQKHGSESNWPRVAAMKDQAAGQGGPCGMRQQAGVPHLGDSSWWRALYKSFFCRSRLQRPPMYWGPANRQGSAANDADVDAWGWTALGMKVAIFPNALNGGQPPE